MSKTVTENQKTRAPRSQIEDLQPLSWEMSALPAAFRFVYALRMPEHWPALLKSLSEVDRTHPVRSFYACLQALAPEIVHIFPGAFRDEVEKRPPYWFVADIEGEAPSEERLLWAVLGWLHASYSLGEIRSVTSQLRASDLRWEVTDLLHAPQSVVEAVLPGLVARWLLKKEVPFRLSNKDGQQISSPLRLVPSSGPEVDLVTWEPISRTHKTIEYDYSYYLRFRVGSFPGQMVPRLLCQPGIRRWVSRPLAGMKKNGQPFIDLPWGREKGVFVARQSASWLTQQPAQTSLLRLGLVKYHDLVWIGRLPHVLASLSPHEQIPDALHLLSHPKEFSPRILLVYDTMMSQQHIIGAGIEEADRWEVFTHLTAAFPPELRPTEQWHKLSPLTREQHSFAGAEHRHVSDEVRLQGVMHMPTPAHIEICSTQPEQWKKWLLEEIGATQHTDAEGNIRLPMHTGDQVCLRITHPSFSPQLFEELPPEAAESDDNRAGLTLQRVRHIETTLPQARGNAGLLLEMRNYRTVYASSPREQRRDPKLAAKWGCARTQRKLQCIQPEASDPTSYEERVRNGIRDLLRQMDYRWNPLYMGFKHTSLPEKLDILGLWHIRLKPRRRGENSMSIPLVVHAPAGEQSLYVCLPGEYGPIWYPFCEVALKLPDFSGAYTEKDTVRTFFVRALQDRGLVHSALLLLSEQNIRGVFPEIQDAAIATEPEQLIRVLGLTQVPCRLARLRFSGYGDIPLVCPPHSFGRFSGLFHDERQPDIFYSLQERPVSASRPKGLRQRDAETKHSWNPSTVEIMLLNLQAHDHASEWAWVVHRLRQESCHVDRATLLPEPLHGVARLAEYVPRIAEEE